MTDAQVRREALRLVNGARGAVGVALLDDLPHGIRDDCGSCPIAHALEEMAAACGYAFVNADVSHAEFYPGPDSMGHQPEQVARVAAAWGGTAWEAGPAENVAVQGGNGMISTRVESPHANCLSGFRLSR